MEKTYRYKRVGFRKIVCFLTIISALTTILYLCASLVSEFIPLLILLLVANLALLYLAFKKTYVAVGEDYLVLFEKKTIKKEAIESIVIQDRRIKIIVKKNTFLLGTYLYFTNACFYSPQDWNDFKKDLELLKTKLP